MTALPSRSFWLLLALRLIGAALLIAAFLRAAAAVNRAAGTIGWADALVPLLCVAGAGGALVLEAWFNRRLAKTAGPNRSAAVRALHRELDAITSRRVPEPRDGPEM